MGFKTPSQQRAWIALQNSSVDGIAKGHAVGFDVSIPSRRPIGWALKTDGIPIASGVIRAWRDGRSRTVPTLVARARHWVSIWVGDVTMPLKVWVHTDASLAQRRAGSTSARERTPRSWSRHRPHSRCSCPTRQWRSSLAWRASSWSREPSSDH